MKIDNLHRRSFGSGLMLNKKYSLTIFNNHR